MGEPGDIDEDFGNLFDLSLKDRLIDGGEDPTL